MINDDDTDNLPVTPNTFRPDTMNAQIFNLNAPYDNPYQGNRRRMLFVCSAGLLRSPTGAFVGQQRGWNTRACGSHTRYALIPLSVNLIAWANKIIFVNPENLEAALRTFKNTGYEEEIEQKSVVLNIPDRYEAFDPKLIQIFEEALDEFEYLEGNDKNSET